MAETYEQIMTIEEMKDRDKWLAMRRTGIGGSDVGVIIGVNKWRSLFSLWLEKTGQEPSEEPSERERNEFLYWGNALESIIAKRFEEDTGKKVRRKGMIRSKQYPWLIADVDREVVGENSCVEIKTTASWKGEEWEGDNLPDQYYCQIMSYLLVGGYDKCYVCCLIGGNKYVMKEVCRNEEDIAGIIEATGDFWNNFVVPKRLPAADASAEFAQLASKMFPGKDGEALELGGEYDATFDRIVDYKHQIKQLENLCKEEENKVKLMLEDNTKAYSPRYSLTYSPAKPKTLFDSKRFQKDYPKLFDEYSKQSAPSRMLRIKKNKEEE